MLFTLLLGINIAHGAATNFSPDLYYAFQSGGCSEMFLDSRAADTGVIAKHQRREVFPNIPRDSYHSWRIRPITGQIEYFGIESGGCPDMFLDSRKADTAEVGKHPKREAFPNIGQDSYHSWRIQSITGQTGYFGIESGGCPEMFLDSRRADTAEVGKHPKREAFPNIPRDSYHSWRIIPLGYRLITTIDSFQPTVDVMALFSQSAKGIDFCAKQTVSGGSTGTKTTMKRDIKFLDRTEISFSNLEISSTELEVNASADVTCLKPWVDLKADAHLKVSKYTELLQQKRSVHEVEHTFSEYYETQIPANENHELLWFAKRVENLKIPFVAKCRVRAVDVVTGHPYSGAVAQHILALTGNHGQHLENEGNFAVYRLYGEIIASFGNESIFMSKKI